LYTSLKAEYNSLRDFGGGLLEWVQWVGIATLVAEAAIFQWFDNRMAKNPEGHSPKYYRKHPQLLATKPPMEARTMGRTTITTDRLLTIVALGVGVVLAFVGLTEMFPLFFNCTVYVGAIVAILYSVWRWETASKWNLRRKLLGMAIIFVVYWGFLAFPNHQY
jgi:hypothetical protein